MIVCDEAIKKLGLKPEDTRVIVQGFGNVGSNAALLMSQAGYKITGVIEVDGVAEHVHEQGPRDGVAAAAAEAFQADLQGVEAELDVFIEQ